MLYGTVQADHRNNQISLNIFSSLSLSIFSRAFLERLIGYLVGPFLSILLKLSLNMPGHGRLLDQLAKSS